MSLILERTIKNVNLDLNKRMLGNRELSKIGRLDVRASFNDGEDCDIELQIAPYQYMNKRMLEYWAGMYTQKINRGNDYSILKPSISILIANYKLHELIDIPEYHTVWNLRERNHLDKILCKDIEIHILEIPKIQNINLNDDELALWLKFIENPLNKEVQKNMEEKENKYLKQAQEELSYLSGEPDFKRLVDARAGFLRDQQAFEDVGIETGKKLGLEEGKIIGKEIGEKTGKEKEKKKIAKKLLKRNMSINEIIEITGLTEEEIKKL